MRRLHSLMRRRRSADGSRMRTRVFFVAMLTVALSGCWVFDELDAGNKKLDAYTKKKPEQEASSEPAAGAGGGRKMRASEYFASQTNARQLTPGTLSKEIVNCKLKSGTQFMKEADCASRGGTPQR
jgi:hypothetical protein